MLKYVSKEEQDNIGKKYFIQDARMSLASALLKRLYVCKTLNIPWSQIRFGRKGDSKNGKPCCILPSGDVAPIEFNISHQAGLVALVGCTAPGIEVGVDIVCVNERNDYRTIDAEGFEAWVDIYRDIFSAEESWDMKYNADRFKLLDGTEVRPEQLGRHDRCTVRDSDITIQLPTGETRTFSSELLIDAKLRRFYTFWCYKEAYIKLTGEALLAKWIAQLEFKNVRAPEAGTVARCSTHGTWGERVADAEVWFKGKKLEDVMLEIQAFEEKYMISVAARPKDRVGSLPLPFTALNIEHDVLAYAEAHS